MQGSLLLDRKIEMSQIASPAPVTLGPRIKMQMLKFIVSYKGKKNAQIIMIGLK